MHPAQQIRVARRVGPLRTVRVVNPAHTTMQSAHTGALAVGLRGVAEGDHGEPLRRACQAPERILFVSRVLLHTRECCRVQGLDEEGPDAAHEGGQRAVDGPGGGAGAEVARVRAVLELAHPLGLSVRITRDQPPEPARDQVCGGVNGVHPFSLP